MFLLPDNVTMEMETVCGLCAKELEKEITVGADLYRDL
jgi:hypothetical protein